MGCGEGSVSVGCRVCVYLLIYRFSVEAFHSNMLSSLTVSHCLTLVSHSHNVTVFLIHTDSLSHCLTRALPLFLTLTLTVSHSHSLSHTLPCTRSCSHSVSLPLPLSHSPTVIHTVSLCLTLTVSHSHSASLFLTVTLTLPLTLTVSPHTLPHSHCHTHSVSHSHSVCISIPVSVTGLMKFLSVTLSFSPFTNNRLKSLLTPPPHTHTEGLPTCFTPL